MKLLSEYPLEELIVQFDIFGWSITHHNCNIAVAISHKQAIYAMDMIIRAMKASNLPLNLARV